MHRGGTPARMVTPEPLARNTPKMPAAKKSTMGIPTSTQRTTDQLLVDKRMGVTNKEI
jgi:hypothetical protein